MVGGCGAALPAAAAMLLPICFPLLAAAAPFTLDEPASLVVDVTPTGPGRRTSIRAVARVVRTRTGEPGAAAGTAVVLVPTAPSLVPQIARWVRTFPAPSTGLLFPPPRMVDRPRRVRGGNRHIGLRPRPAPWMSRVS